MPNIGPMELAVVVIIALVIFGPKKLPELGNSLGKGMLAPTLLDRLGVPLPGTMIGARLAPGPARPPTAQAVRLLVRNDSDEHEERSTPTEPTPTTA